MTLSLEKKFYVDMKTVIKEGGQCPGKKASGREAFSFLLEYIAAVNLALSTLLYEGKKQVTVDTV